MAKGHTAWNKGMKGVTLETSQKMSKSAKLRRRLPCSNETKEKSRIKAIGRKFGPTPEDRKEKMRKALKGKPCPHPNRKSRKGIQTRYIPKSAFKTGHKAWNFVDGRSNRLDLKIRYGENWPKIRQQAIIRDQYVCQKCGIDNVPFEVHHIISFLITRDNSLDNLVTLCKRCHRKIEAMEMKMYKNKEVA
jgi:hypothetical protein